MWSYPRTHRAAHLRPLRACLQHDVAGMPLHRELDGGGAEVGPGMLPGLQPQVGEVQMFANGGWYLQTELQAPPARYDVKPSEVLEVEELPMSDDELEVAVTSDYSDPLVGRDFVGKYRIRNKLGEGGFGTVYRAIQLAVGREVAVKVLRPDRATDDRLRDTLVKRFQREAIAMSKLGHPNTVQLIDFGTTEDEILFLVLELLDGFELSQIVATQAPMRPTRVAHVCRQICMSLAEAHGSGIIHRDLKPGNVFLCHVAGDDDFVKVMDFGIARLVDPDASQITRTGMTQGTPAYMSPELFKSMQTDTKGEFGGIGIEIGMESGVVKVITPIDDTPASRAGVKAGDYIIKIEENQVQGKSLMEAVKLMRGLVGTNLEITVRRKGKKKPLIFNLKREIIEVKSVSTSTLGEKEKIGYLRLKSFNENSDAQLIKQIKLLEKNSRPIGYIIDLRNNPGGLLNQAISITDYFLEDGEIVSTKGRKLSESRKFFARKGDVIKGKPIIVLINNGSASASEILAGALKDHKRAIILGENTYGKGSVQSIIPLRNGGGMRLTISKYYLPSGKSISEVGVTPDILVEEENDSFEINTKTDNQLTYAVNLFKS